MYTFRSKLKRLQRQNTTSKEVKRLREDKLRAKNWKRWGPYLSERQWGSVREDYSSDGDCWSYFPHDHARSRAYRWGEDGLMGISDREGRLCLSLALWNTKDPILKERLYGLTSHQGNHGEDVKELYYYLDNTPTHSYMKALYKYPQAAFPYQRLEEENAKRGVDQPEFELLDTGIFDENRYFDVKAEYCKETPNDILGKYTIVNRGPDPAVIHVVPTLWFRNVWSWGQGPNAPVSLCDINKKPYLKKVGSNKVECFHPTLGICQTRQRVLSVEGYEEDETANQTPNPFYFEVEVGPEDKPPQLLFTENDTNYKRLFGMENSSPYVKDAFHEFIVNGNVKAVNPNQTGTKCAAQYIVSLNPGEKTVIRVRLYYALEPPVGEVFGKSDFEFVFHQRKLEADMFYDEIIKNKHIKEKDIIRQAYAGLLWSKQFYYYVVDEWLHGDFGQPPPAQCRLEGRNSEWKHLFNRDVISMPDKWEYPWYAAWDLAFHMIPMANIDIKFAKDQLLLMLKEWYMHPNGQIPAYEFAFDDVNPPVHCYAVLKVYKASRPKGSGPKEERDVVFLAKCFHKLVLNFTWWVNRKDINGKNIFSGGFLGLDNIGVFDRSKPFCGVKIDQADATAWVAFFCLIMLEISLILSKRDRVYEDMACKFFEHFVAIVDAINGRDGTGLWDEADGFYYDHLRQDNKASAMKIMSMVGLVPLFSCMVLKEETRKKFPEFFKRTNWFLENRKDLSKTISFMTERKQTQNLLLAIVSKEKLVRVLKHMLDPDKFLSPYGIRSLSKHHKEQPFVLNENSAKVGYEPGESESKLFGGNSNWRGPIWFPMNYLLIENLFRYDYYYGESLQVEFPTGSGTYMRLGEVAKKLSQRLADIFTPDLEGHRPCHGSEEKYAKDPDFQDLILFYEYFHGETGRGCGASHQTGWTALIANTMNYLHKWSIESDSDHSSDNDDEFRPRLNTA